MGAIDDKMLLNFTTCAACLLFLQGLCGCFLNQKGGPRATTQCVSCTCVTLRYVMKKKKHACKNLYHMSNTTTCDCNVSCGRTGNGTRCTKLHAGYSRIAYHPDCMQEWVQCSHMKRVAEELEVYSAYIEEKGDEELPEVLSGCCPLIGYSKKSSSMIAVKNPDNFIRRRRDAIWRLRMQKHEQHILFEPIDTIALPLSSQSLRSSRHQNIDEGQTMQEIESTFTDSSHDMCEESSQDSPCQDITKNDVQQKPDLIRENSLGDLFTVLLKLEKGSPEQVTYIKNKNNFFTTISFPDTLPYANYCWTTYFSTL